VRVGTDEDYDGPVFVIDQVKPGGSFDEHKVMIGWKTRGAAIYAYLSAYQPGWHVGPVTRLSMDEFVAWLESGDTTLPVSKAGEDDWAAEISGADWTPLEEALSVSLTRQLRRAGIAELASIRSDNADWPVTVNEYASEYAAARSAELITGLADSTRDMIRADVTDAIDSNASAAQLAGTISDAYAFSGARAATIARTELVRAYHAGNVKVGELAGAVGKYWVLGSEHGDSGDDECDDNVDDDVIAFDEVFSSGDEFPPAHPNCACDLVNVYPDDEEAADLIDEGDEE
jgi:hypothetical protein